MKTPLLEVRDLKIYYPVHAGVFMRHVADVKAVDGVSFTVTPAITGLSRIAGPEGVSVTITGTSFGAVQGTGTVTFNGTAVTTYSSWSDTSITVTVPAGATSAVTVPAHD